VTRVFVLLSLLLPACSTLPGHAVTVDVFNPDSIDSILATDPSTLSPEQFYRYEFAVVHGYSGSGGHFLEDEQIAWLRKAEAAFQARGIPLKDEWQRDYVIADSYLNAGEYEKALEEYRKLGNQYGSELSEWFVNNGDLLYAGQVKVFEHDGEIPCSASETARAENERYVFVAYFKGPVYRYDKLTRKHALIYAPRDKYDWCDELELEDSKVIIQLRRGEAGTYAFDNARNEIRGICNVLREARSASLR
jgi:tetratricopeptide (TPR) repeat protein